MYLIKTDFKKEPMTVNESDTAKLIEVSIDVAQHVCNVNIAAYSFEAEARLKVFDKNNGNVYAIIIYAKSPFNELCFTYSYKYNDNNEALLYNSDVFFSDWSLYIQLPLGNTYPDSIYVNFDDSFKVDSYEVSYRSVIRHYIYENEEYDKTSIVDFTYKVKNNTNSLMLEYNYWLKETKPEEYFQLTKENLNEEQLKQDELFLNLLNYVDSNSFAMKALFDYMEIEKIKTASGFEAAYEYFTIIEDKEMIKNKIEVIKMENI
jgi:hypothetical protein